MIRLAENQDSFAHERPFFIAVSYPRLDLNVLNQSKFLMVKTKSYLAEQVEFAIVSEDQINVVVLPKFTKAVLSLQEAWRISTHHHLVFESAY